MRGLPDTRVTRKTADMQPLAANVVVDATLPADSAHYHVLDAVEWSYDNTPATGRLTASVGGVTKFDVDIRAAGAGRIRFPGGMYGGKNQAMIVTLAAAVGAKGKVAIQYR